MIEREGSAHSTRSGTIEMSAQRHSARGSGTISVVHALRNPR
jgi:hypothetical protein